ncbi:MAG: tetratricopeptide repeat protein [Chitinophagales bacterium]|nr:tetratricopeptide repeat protein [Chitinophagales bacterium]
MRTFLFLLVLSLFISCERAREKEVVQINASIDSVNKYLENGTIDSARTQKTEESINRFVQFYSKDSLASKYLFQLAVIYEKQRSFAKSLTTLEQVYQKYPSSKEAPNAVFLQGFLYANVLNNLNKAKEKYQLYLSKYSNINPKVTRDVQLEIQNLGKTPDEILKEIQEKSKQDSTVRPV